MRDRAFNSTLRPISRKRQAKLSAERKPRAPIAKVNEDRAKAKHLRNFGEEHDSFVRAQPCIARDLSPCFGRIEAAHASHRGMGGCKGDKTQLFPACTKHHDEYDGRCPLPDGSVGRAAFVAFYGVDPTEVAARLWAESPENPERHRMTLADALEAVDDSLPDGAWMQALCDLTGLDAGDVSDGLSRLHKEQKKGRRLVGAEVQRV